MGRESITWASASATHHAEAHTAAATADSAGLLTLRASCGCSCTTAPVAALRTPAPAVPHSLAAHLWYRARCDHTRVKFDHNTNNNNNELQ